MQALPSSSLDLSSWNINSSAFEDDFIEIDQVMDSKNPGSEFDSYLTPYTDYDSIMNKTISTVKDLDVAAGEFFMSPKQNTMASPANTSLLFHNLPENDHKKSPLVERNNGLGLSLSNPPNMKTHTISNSSDFSLGGQTSQLLDMSNFAIMPQTSFSMAEDFSQDTITPATLAKYSKMLNMSNVPQQPNISGSQASPHRSSQSPIRPPQSPTKVTKSSPSKSRRNRHGGSLTNIDTSNLISTDIYLPPSTPSSHRHSVSSPSYGGVNVPSSPVASPYNISGGNSGLASVNASPQHKQPTRGKHKSRPSSSMLLMPLQDGDDETDADQLRQRLTLHSRDVEQQSKNQQNADLYNTSPRPGFSPTLDQFDNTPESASVPQFLNAVTPNPGSLEMFANGVGVADMIHPLMPPPPSPTKSRKTHGTPNSQIHPQLVQPGTQLYEPLGGMPPQVALITPQQQLLLQQHHQQQQISPEQFQQIYALEQAAALGGHSQVFQVLNGAIVPTGVAPNDGSDAIAWQPVITAPSNQTSEEIIKTQQQPTVHPGNRKSCLPPGKVDSYLLGPNEEGLFLCLFPNCGKYFKRRYNVRSHIQTHLCDRPYLCEICQATFVRPHDLRRHEKCHRDEKPFVCPCGKTFTRHDALQRHRSRMICEGGIEIPGKPKKPPGKRGRPRKNPDPNADEPDSAKQDLYTEDQVSTVSPSSYSSDATPVAGSDLSHEYDHPSYDMRKKNEAPHSSETYTPADRQFKTDVSGETCIESYIASSSVDESSYTTATLSRTSSSATCKSSAKKGSAEDKVNASMSKFTIGSGNAASSSSFDGDSESDRYSPYTSSPEEILETGIYHSHELHHLKGNPGNHKQRHHETFLADDANTTSVLGKNSHLIDDHSNGSGEADSGGAGSDLNVVDPIYLQSWTYE